MGKGLVKDANGLEWINRGEGTDDHLTLGGHEPAIVAVAMALMPEGGVFLDVGAHVGLYTLNLARKAGKIISVEANPRTARVLQMNCENNKDKHKAEIWLAQFAAWDKNNVSLRLVDEKGFETGGSTHCEPLNGPVSVDQTVQAFRLDYIMITQGIPFPDLVKIDVEGAEANVLRGMTGILDRGKRPIFVIEMHDQEYNRPEVRTEVLDFLDSRNYSWNDDLKHGGQYYVIAKPAEAVDDFEIETVRAGE